jgi:hypothetical protein
MSVIGFLPSQGKMLRSSIRFERLFFSLQVSTFFDPHSRAMISKLFAALSALDAFTAFLFSPGSTPAAASSRFSLAWERLISG